MERGEAENEAEAENSGGYHAVVFSYGAPSESSEQKSVNAEFSFRPPFTVPEHLLQNLVGGHLSGSFRSKIFFVLMLLFVCLFDICLVWRHDRCLRCMCFSKAYNV